MARSSTCIKLLIIAYHISKYFTIMPGTILNVLVKAGDTVTEGQNLMVLEAMKMENEILSPKAGKVAQVAVTKGSTVATGDLLAVIE